MSNGQNQSQSGNNSGNQGANQGTNQGGKPQDSQAAKDGSTTDVSKTGKDGNQQGGDAPTQSGSDTSTR
jgi:hypothetical protein